MNREILFRGKRTDNWVEGYYVAYPDGKEAILRKCDNLPDGDPMWKKVLIEYEVDSKTICRYTGFNDKNGRKIFEGDIVRVVDTDRENQVFDIGHIHFEEGAWFLGDEMLFWFDNIISFEFEVIGNIFDNSELLD